MNELDKTINDLKELYNDNPKETLNRSQKVLNELYRNRNEGNIMLPCILFSISIELLGFLNNNSVPIFLYVTCSMFFLAGIFVGLFKKYTGILFLFLFGMIMGFGEMYFPIINDALNSPIMTDNPILMKLLIIISLVFIILGIIGTIFYNVSEEIKEKKYSLEIILLLYFIGLVLIELLPIIFNRDFYEPIFPIIANILF
ncbi:MAG: hypothetical protein PUA90_05275 [bacterium]|nr:hypothetical protein [bacterium]